MLGHGEGRRGWSGGFEHLGTKAKLIKFLILPLIFGTNNVNESSNASISFHTHGVEGITTPQHYTSIQMFAGPGDPEEGRHAHGDTPARATRQVVPRTEAQLNPTQPNPPNSPHLT